MEKRKKTKECGLCRGMTASRATWEGAPICFACSAKLIPKQLNVVAAHWKTIKERIDPAACDIGYSLDPLLNLFDRFSDEEPPE